MTILKIASECYSSEIEIEIFSNGALGGVPISKVESIEIRDLPPFKVGILYIVDFCVAYAARAEGRIISDLLMASEPAYGEDGSFIGYRSLSFFQ